MEKELLNVINVAYDRLETKQAEIVHALSHGKDELRSGWYNHHYHKDDRGNWVREAYPIPVIGVNGVCDIEIHFDTISVTAKLPLWRIPLKNLQGIHLRHTAWRIIWRTITIPGRLCRK